MADEDTPAANTGKSGSMRVRWLGPIVLAVALLIVVCCLVKSYNYLLCKGIICTCLGLFFFAVLLERLKPSSIWPEKLRHDYPWLRKTAPPRDTSEKYPLLWSTLFLSLTTVFLLSLPYSEFLRAVGLVPGIAFIAILAFLRRGLSGESALPSLAGIVLWCLVVWLWGEAGREGFVVMP